MTPCINESQKRHLRRYLLGMGFGFSAYMASVVGFNVADRLFELSIPIRVGLRVIPVLCALYVLYVMVKFVRRMDEVQARIITESALIAACVVGLATFTYGFMEDVLALPDISLIWILPSLIMCQGVAQFFVRLNYQ